LSRLEGLIADRKRAVDVFHVLFKRKINDQVLSMATGESLAHLNCLLRRGLTPMVEVRLFQPGDLDGVIALCAAEGWPSFPEDPARALRALTAPGVTTVVAADGDDVAGFAQLLSDGEIQAHLSLIAVAPAYRRQNLA